MSIQLDLFGTPATAPSVALSVQIGDEQILLNRCDWVLWGPCGCPFGVTVGATKTGSIVNATEGSAWKSFYDTKRQIEKAIRRGERLELITHDRWCAEVMDRMKARCTHEAAP